MKRTLIKGFLLLIVICLSALPSVQVWADDEDLTYSLSFTDDELDNLLAPIALYPDPLLAQMLPASTYPMEIADAEEWTNRVGGMSGMDEQPWDESVRAIARYPGILQMMAGNLDWTANLGDAFLNQPEDVTNSIQRLRWRARAVGNLVSSNEQSVIIEGDYIRIVPAQPQYVYVPQYEPSVVYVESPPSYAPFITFGYGLAIGGWLTMDFDWGHHHVIYHGWNRPGWVNHARPYVHIRDVYVNRSRPSIHERWRHDRSHGDPARYLQSRPSGPKSDWHRRTGEVRGNTAIQPRPAGERYDRGGDSRAYSNRGRESRGIVNQLPKPPTPGISQRPTPPTPHISDRPKPPTPGLGQRPTPPTPHIGDRPKPPTPGIGQKPTPPTPSISRPQPGPDRDRERVKPDKTPSGTFGGYRGDREAKEESLRGQKSRQSSEGASRGRAPAGRNAPGGDRQRR